MGDFFGENRSLKSDRLSFDLLLIQNKTAKIAKNQEKWRIFEEITWNQQYFDDFEEINVKDSWFVTENSVKMRETWWNKRFFVWNRFLEDMFRKNFVKLKNVKFWTDSRGKVKGFFLHEIAFQKKLRKISWKQYIDDRLSLIVISIWMFFFCNLWIMNS